MRFRFLAILFLWTSCTSVALADQYSFTTLEQAAAAMKLVEKQKVIHSFCAPCNETASVPIQVGSLGIARIWDTGATPLQSYWELQVNDTGVDLAYIYFQQDGRWKNLAMALGLEVHASPEYLEPKQIGRE